MMNAFFTLSSEKQIHASRSAERGMEASTSETPQLVRNSSLKHLLDACTNRVDSLSSLLDTAKQHRDFAQTLYMHELTEQLKDLRVKDASSPQLRQWLSLLYRTMPHCDAIAIYLDSYHRIVGIQAAPFGYRNSYPELDCIAIQEECLRVCANRVILASPDVHFLRNEETREYASIAATHWRTSFFGSATDLVDWLIVDGDAIYSFAENGLLDLRRHSIFLAVRF